MSDEMEWHLFSPNWERAAPKVLEVIEGEEVLVSRGTLRGLDGKTIDSAYKYAERAPAKSEHEKIQRLRVITNITNETEEYFEKYVIEVMDTAMENLGRRGLPEKSGVILYRKVLNKLHWRYRQDNDPEANEYDAALVPCALPSLLEDLGQFRSPAWFDARIAESCIDLLSALKESKSLPWQLKKAMRLQKALDDHEAWRQYEYPASKKLQEETRKANYSIEEIGQMVEASPRFAPTNWKAAAQEVMEKTGYSKSSVYEKYKEFRELKK